MNKLTRYSQALRRNVTKEERKLWYDFLKNLPVAVKRQKVVCGYIVDFYCEKCHVIIELDGSQRYDDEGIEKDKARDAELKGQGFTVLRYSNYDVNKRFRNNCEDISNYLLADDI